MSAALHRGRNVLPGPSRDGFVQADCPFLKRRSPVDQRVRLWPGSWRRSRSHPPAGSSDRDSTAIQIARARGARVFGFTAGSAEKCSACESLMCRARVLLTAKRFRAAVKAANRRTLAEICVSSTWWRATMCRAISTRSPSMAAGDDWSPGGGQSGIDVMKILGKG